MRPLALAVLSTALVGCAEPGDEVGDPDPVSDTEVDTDRDPPVDTEVADTEVADTEVDDTTVDDPGDPRVDTSTPLAEAVDGPYRGTWAPRGGTRLVAVHVLHQGASEPAFAWFHDTLLDVDCRFGLAEDGRLRCLPEPGIGAFAQAGDCATTGALLGATCDDRRYGRSVSGGRCTASTASVFGIAPDPAVTELGDLGDTGGCETSPLPDDQVFAAAGPHVPPSRFVRGLARHVPAGGDLDVVVVRGADGSVQPIGFYDPVRDAACAPTHFVGEPDDLLRCAPVTDVATTWEGYREPFGLVYADDTCATPYAVPGDACDDLAPDHGLDAAAPWFHEVLHPGLHPVAAVSELGGTVTRAFDWSLSYDPDVPDTCDDVDLTQPAYPSPMRALLDTVTPASLPALRRGGAGEEGVRVNAWLDGDGLALVPVDLLPFVDADGTACAPVWNEDLASVRCVPYVPGVFTGDYTGGCRVPTVDPSRGIAEGDVTLRSLGGSDCFGAWRIGRTGPYVVGPPVPAGTWLSYEERPWGCPNSFVVEELRPRNEATPDPRPVSAWPALTLDR